MTIVQQLASYGGALRYEDLPAEVPQLSGEVAFKLHDTFGFPIDLTIELAAEHGVGVDRAGFDTALAEQRDRSRSGKKAELSKHAGLTAIYQAVHARAGDTAFLGYDTTTADGRVVVVQKARDPYLDREALKISVFMNVFNVHSNRSPVDGTVRKRWYHGGSFLNAVLDKASLENERNALWFRTRCGRDVTCVQVAGLVARRILCYVGEGNELARGERYGFIRFGSRVDLYLPPDSEPKAALGDKVHAAESVLARLSAIA